jgi:D-alanyl-D-alanine carboxypeptidase
MYQKPLLTIALLITYLTCNAQNIQIAESLRVKYGIPELAFAVLTADKVIEEQYLGYHKTGQTAKDDTARKTDYFHLGSNTKAITGFIAAYLVEKNKIKWSTKLFDIFPEWKKQANPAYYQVTLQDLLSHRAKIQPYTSGGEYQNYHLLKGIRLKRGKSLQPI